MSGFFQLKQPHRKDHTVKKWWQILVITILLKPDLKYCVTVNRYYNPWPKKQEGHDGSFIISTAFKILQENQILSQYIWNQVTPWAWLILTLRPWFEQTCLKSTRQCYTSPIQTLWRFVKIFLYLSKIKWPIGCVQFCPKGYHLRSRQCYKLNILTLGNVVCLFLWS